MPTTSAMASNDSSSSSSSRVARRTSSGNDAPTEPSASSHDAYTLAILAVEESNRSRLNGTTRADPVDTPSPHLPSLSTPPSQPTATTDPQQIADGPVVHLPADPVTAAEATASFDPPPHPNTPTAAAVDTGPTPEHAVPHSQPQDTTRPHPLLGHRKSSSIEIRRQPTPALLMPVLETDSALEQDDSSTRQSRRQDASSRTIGNHGDTPHSHDSDECYDPSKQTQTSSKSSNKSVSSRSLKYRRSSGLSTQNLCGLRCVQWLCLRPHFTLQAQLMMSFGTVHALGTIFVVVTCVVMVFVIGQNVKNVTSSTFRHSGDRVQAQASRYLAEALEERIYPKDLIEILYQVTADRMEGYNTSDVNIVGTDQDGNPIYTNEGTATDIYVPFMDMVSNTNQYPVIGPRLNMDWDFTHESTIVVTPENEQEHVQKRARLYNGFERANGDGDPIPQLPVSTSSASFVLQGGCDPTDTDPISPLYLPNCTAANNDITTGGTIAPTSHAQHLHRKGKDIVPILKAMYEFNQDVREFGVYFVNQGAGASINFPQYPTSSLVEYTSIGCDWLNEPHPYDPSRTIGTGPGGYDLTKFCHPEGTRLKTRENYNPIERGWFRDMALDPDNVVVGGPYLDAFTPNFWLLSLGRAVYDRRTNDLIACTYMSISVDFLEDILKEIRLTPNSEVSVIRWDEQGTVVASSAFSIRTAERTVSISETNIGVTADFYQQLYNLVPYGEEEWDPQEVQKLYQTTTFDAGEYLTVAYPIPIPPDTYDPNYRPEYLAVVSTSTLDLSEPVSQLNDDVDDNLNQAIIFAIAAGFGSIVFAFLVIMLVARTITAPLYEMNATADSIVNSFGEERANAAGKNPNAVDVKSGSNNIADEEISAGLVDGTLGHGSQSAGAKSASFSTSPDAFQKVESKARVSWLLCSPVTEITLVVKEFNKMVSNFSGSLMAHSEKSKLMEARNRFFLREQFAELYKQRAADDFAYNLSSSPRNTRDLEVSYEFVHQGRNVDSGTATTVGASTQAGLSSEDEDDDSSEIIEDAVPRTFAKQMRSPLFLWIVTLIVTPLLLTTVTISIVVLLEASKEFQESVDRVREQYLQFELSALAVYTTLRSDYIGAQTSQSIRNVYLMTRYSSWLLFGALDRTASFTNIASDMRCKDYATLDACPLVEDNRICDCAWNELEPPQCTDYPPHVSRHLQYPYFALAKDGNLANGTRWGTRYPDSSTSPSMTDWYTDVNTLPGSQKQSAASGYATSYDRLRVLSAMPLFAPLQNYDPTNRDGFDYFISMEDDGLLVANRGCRNSEQAIVAFWKSTDENGANTYRPELCPVGKYGYDPRCREWYHTGRTLSKPAADRESVPLYLTPPYEFISGKVAQSATLSLVDPDTGRHVGQTLIDFHVDKIVSVLDQERTPLTEGGFHILVTPSVEAVEAQVVAGPTVTAGNGTKPLPVVLDALGAACDASKDRCEKWKEDYASFSVALTGGQSGIMELEQNAANGDIETIYIAYSPVFVNAIHQLNGADFTAGIRSNPKHMIYGLALAERRDGLLKPFTNAESDLEQQTTIGVAVVAVAITVSILTIIYISYLVTQSITDPMWYLLNLVRCLNNRDTSQDPPKVNHSKGSREIISVSCTMDTLYRVVKLANEAFYAGELGTAYHVLIDSLSVFRRLKNKKAIGVVCNNLGNTMLAIYREMKQSKVDTLYGLTKQELIKKGTAYFHEAIKVGEAAYDEFYICEGWTPNCLDFMQHLSNRYFNRGMFHLTIKDDHKQPDEIAELGNRDLQIARDMDVEIVDQGIETGWGCVNRAEKLFNVYLVRIRGYLLLLEHGFPDDGQAKEHLDEIQELFETEKKKLLQPRGSSALFAEVGPTGRMQQVEAELAKYHLFLGDLETAAKIAIRMLFEDEYIFVDAQLQVMETLQLYTARADSIGSEYARVRLARKIEELNEALCHELETARQVDSGGAMAGLVLHDSSVKSGHRPSRLSSSTASTRFSTTENPSRKTSFMVDAERASGSNAGTSLNTAYGSDDPRRSKRSRRWSISERSGQFVTMERF